MAAINLFASKQYKDGAGRVSQITTQLIKNLVRLCSEISKDIDKKNLRLLL